MGTINKQNLIQLWKKTKLYVADKLEDYVSKEELSQEIDKHLAGAKFVNPKLLTFTGAAETEYDGSETVSVEIPEKETVIAEETVLASGVIAADSTVATDTGISLTDLQKWKIFGVRIQNRANGKEIGLSENNAWSWYDRIFNFTQANNDTKQFVAIFEWADSKKTVLKPLSLGGTSRGQAYIDAPLSDTLNSYMIGNFINGDGYSSYWKPSLIMGFYKGQFNGNLFIHANGNTSADVTWDIRGLIKW